MRQYKAQLEQQVQHISTELEKCLHVSNQQREGQSAMLPLTTGHQSFCDEQIRQQTCRSRYNGNDQRSSQSVGRFGTGKGNNRHHERKTIVGFCPHSELSQRQ